MIPATGIRIVRIFGITCVDDADAQTRAGIQVFGRRIGKALPQTPVIRESATGGRSNWDASRRGSRRLRLRETARTRSGWYCATLPWGEQKPAPQDMPVISVAFDAPLSHPAVIRSERLLGKWEEGRERIAWSEEGHGGT
jgi:hypothetical protein